MDFVMEVVGEGGEREAFMAERGKESRDSAAQNGRAQVV